MTQQSKNRQYALELCSVLVLYALILTLSVHMAGGALNAATRLLIVLLPVLPIGLAIWVIVRHFRRIDEYLRKVTLENLGIAAAVTAGLSLSYGFLEGAGFPKLTMFVVWPVMAFVWLVLALVRSNFCR